MKPLLRVAVALFGTLFINSAIAQDDLRSGAIGAANRAVELVKDIDGVSLDYSKDSLKEIDRIVLGIRKDEGNDPSQFQHVLFLLGAYVGEVIVTNLDGAAWSHPPKNLIESGIADESEIWLKINDDTYYNPIGKVFKLMLNGEEDSVYFFYNHIASENS